jgi:hypothetical protein
MWYRAQKCSVLRVSLELVCDFDYGLIWSGP